MHTIARDPRKIVLIPIAEIIRDLQPWHVRVHVNDADVKRLGELIRATGKIDPITVIPTSGGYILGLGLVRLLTAEYLGDPLIPAYLEPELNPLALLRQQLADDEAGARYSTLERAWALHKLRELSAAAGLTLTPKEICEQRKLDKGTVSLFLRAAEVIPLERVKKVAAEYGLDWREVASLPRDAVRPIATRPSPLGEELLNVACRALAQRDSPVRAVKDALAKIAPYLPPARTGLRARAPALLMKIWAWLIALAARGIAALRQWSKTPNRTAPWVRRRTNGQSTSIPHRG